MRTLAGFIISCLVMQTAMCQTYRASAPLPAVEKDGFYQIEITPSAASYINSRFSNVRVTDNKNTEIPFVYHVEEGKRGEVSFKGYQIVEKVILKDSCTILVLANASNTIINNISLQIKNADVSKVTSLAGSDDQKTWYALKEKFSLGFIDNRNGTATVKIIDFPNSNYKYYRLWIDDKTSAPLNVIAAGYYNTTESSGPGYTLLHDFRFNQSNDTNQKRSIIKSKFDTACFVNKITWHVSGLPYYHRNARLYTMREQLDRRGRKEQYEQLIATFEVNSRQQNVLFIPEVKTDNLIIEIDNDDNPPLKIDSIQLYQLNRYLTVYLEKGRQYKLNVGTDEMPDPVYDLNFFKDSIPANASIITPGDIVRIEQATQAGDSDFFTSKTFIWAALIVVIVVLGFMSIKLVRETNTSNK